MLQLVLLAATFAPRAPARAAGRVDVRMAGIAPFGALVSELRATHASALERLLARTEGVLYA